MPFQPRRLRVPEIPWSASELRADKMPRTVYRGLHLRLRVVHTNATAVGLTIDNLLKLLPRVGIIIDGQDNVVQVSAHDLYYMNRYDYSIAPTSTIVTADGAGQVSTVDLYLPFALTRAANPQDTLLDARAVTEIALELTWGTATVVATSGVTVTAASVQVNTDEYTNVPADLKAGRHELTAIEFNLDRLGEIEVKLPTGSDHQYRRLFLYTRGGSNELSNAEIDNIAVSSRSFEYLNIQSDRLQAHGEREAAIASIAGMYPINFLRDGLVVHRIDARQLPELILKLNSLVTDGKARVLMDKAIFL